MALYKTRQLLANFSRQSVRDLSVSRLEKLYAPVVAQRRQADLDNEQAFEMNIPHLEHVKRLLAQELEQMATEENAHMPITDVFSALQVVKQSKVSENDIGVRALETMLTSMWRKDRTASITSAKFTALIDHFRKNYPRSAVCEVLEKIGESGYMSLEVSKLAALAQDISSQEDYERVILENGLQSNSPNCKKARQFILALVNGDDERSFERTAQEDEEFEDDDLINEPEDEGEGEPEEGDYILSPTGRLGGQTQVSQMGGGVLGTVTEYEDAIRLIDEDMKKSNFYPNVWTVSDHGNTALVMDFNEDVKNLPPKQEEPEDDYDDEFDEDPDEDLV